MHVSTQTALFEKTRCEVNFRSKTRNIFIKYTSGKIGELAAGCLIRTLRFYQNLFGIILVKFSAIDDSPDWKMDEKFCRTM